jgi:L-ornithine N5-oxygenase
VRAYDLIGIGFGPSNLGLAVALFDDYKVQVADKKIGFFESKKEQAWHHPMMLPGSKMQISFMKDLCFLRNPRSYFTFVNYLMTQGRLRQFANIRDFTPSRREFDDYLKWTASHFSSIVEYASRVEYIAPIERHGVVELLEVGVKNTLKNTMHTVKTRNLALAIGGEAKMPIASPSEHVFHSASFLDQIAKYPEDKKHRFLVVGSGQSAAEIYRYLIGTYKASEVWVTCSGIGFKQADDSEYVNDIFDSNLIDTIYSLDAAKRKRLLEKYIDTNYSVADLDIIQEIYREEYERGIGNSTPRHGIKKFQKLHSIEKDGSGLRVTLKSTLTDEFIQLSVDAVICATGYSRANNAKLLKNIEPYMLDPSGSAQLTRGYALKTTETFKPSIFIQGMSESSHGISDTLLSVISARSAEISEEFIRLFPKSSEHTEVCLENY